MSTWKLQCFSQHLQGIDVQRGVLTQSVPQLLLPRLALGDLRLTLVIGSANLNAQLDQAIPDVYWQY
jgi:hypothetical protein